MKKLVNTKTKIWVQNLNEHDFHDVKKVTIWRSHTGVECVKWWGKLYKIKPINQNVKIGMSLPSRVTHELDSTYKVPALPSERSETKALEALVARVEPLILSKDEKRIFKKQSSKVQYELRLKLLDALMKNLQR